MCLSCSGDLLSWLPSSLSLLGPSLNQQGLLCLLGEPSTFPLNRIRAPFLGVWPGGAIGRYFRRRQKPTWRDVVLDSQLLVATLSGGLSWVIYLPHQKFFCIFFFCFLVGIFPPFYLLIFEKLSFVFIMFWLRGIRGINLKGKSLLGRKWEPGRTVVYCLYPLWVFLCLCLSQALSKRRRKGLLRATPAMPGMTTREESIDHFPKSARKEAPPQSVFRTSRTER